MYSSVLVNRERITLSKDQVCYNCRKTSAGRERMCLYIGAVARIQASCRARCIRSRRDGLKINKRNLPTARPVHQPARPVRPPRPPTRICVAWHALGVTVLLHQRESEQADGRTDGQASSRTDGRVDGRAGGRTDG